MDSDAVFGRHILQFVDKLRMGEVVHFPPPQSGHARKIEVFKTDDVVPSAKVVCELPLKVGTSVSDSTMDSVKLFASVLVVVASLFRERQSKRGSFEFVKVTSEKTRIVNTRAVGGRHVCFKAKIHTYGCTIMCLFVGSNGSVENQHDIEIPDSVALYDKPLDCTFIRSAEKESERLTDFVYRQTVFFYLVATLFEDDGCKVFSPLELWRSFGDMVKKPPVSRVKTFNHLLHGLRVNALHPVSLCKMRFQAVGINEFAEHPIVAFMQGETMIPYKGSIHQHC